METKIISIHKKRYGAQGYGYKWGAPAKGMVRAMVTLQRELNIGYVQSMKLIDQLEAAGVISAPDPVTHRRKVL